MKAVSSSSSAKPPTRAERAGSDARGRRRGHQGRGDRALPQRLAWLDGARRRTSRCRMCRATNWPASCSRAGKQVTRWRAGDRVTVPFVGGCGHCFECHSGNHQVCEQQFQPGFTAWGSFAEYVAIDYADTNLVRLPDEMEFATAASLGCRFVTSFRAIVDQGRVQAGRMGGGAWLRRRRAVGDHDRQRHGRQCRSPSTSPTEKLDFAQEDRRGGDRQCARRRRMWSRRSSRSPRAARMSRSTRSATPRPASTRSRTCAGAAAMCRSG